MTDPIANHDNPQYLRGQLLAVQALVFALADITTDKHSFRVRGPEGLDRLRSVLEPMPAAEAQLAGLDAVAQMLRRLTV